MPLCKTVLYLPMAPELRRYCLTAASVAANKKQLAVPRCMWPRGVLPRVQIHYIKFQC